MADEGKRWPAAPPELCDLLAAAKLAPEEDTPRLVAADWLEEHGDEIGRDRAALIRLQCRLLTLYATAADPARHEAIRRLLIAAENHYGKGGAPFLPYARRREAPELGALDMQAAHLAFGAGATLLRPLGPLGPHQWPRGLAWAHMERKAFADRAEADAYADALPGHMLGAVRLMRGWEGELAWLAGCRLMRRLAGLDLGDLDSGPGGAAELLTSPELAGLRRLDVTGRELGDDGLSAVLRAAPWRLKSLTLGRNHLGPAGTRAVAEAPALAGLTDLSLADNPIGPDGGRELARAPFLGKLEVLNLAGARIGPAGLAALVRADGYRGPAVLDLSGCRLGRAGVEVLLEAPGLENLIALSLAHNELDRRAFALLAASPRLSGLLLLEVSGNDRGGAPAGAEELTRSPHLARLPWLHLAWRDERSRRATTVAEAGALRVLQALLCDPPPF